MEAEIAFKIEVRGARNVVPMDPNGQSDPYCLVGLADPQTNAFIDPSNVVRSKTHFVTLNPVWKGFFMIAKTMEHKVRVEVWDKDQDVDDDFEGMAIIDLNTIKEDITDKWIPLVGRTPDENVTGDVNIVVTRGPLESLQRQRSNSLSQSQGIEKPKEAKDDERTIKRLTADLKTKSGRLEQMKESNSVLDLHVVRLKQQVELLQAEVIQKSSILAGKEDALAKANAYALELQQALQEKQSVNKIADEWNKNIAILEQMQSTLKAKSLQHRKKEKEETKGGEGAKGTEEDKKGAEKMERFVEEWTEYALLIETLEAQLKEKEEGEKKAYEHLTQKVEEEEKVQETLTKQLEESRREKETLVYELQAKEELLETTRVIVEESRRETEILREELQITKEKAEAIKRETDSLRDEMQNTRKQVEESTKEIQTLRIELKEKEELLEIQKEKEKQIGSLGGDIERLQNELAEKTTELRLQQARGEKIKEDLQVVEQLTIALKVKEEEVETLRKEVEERKKEKEEEEGKRKREKEEEEERRKIEKEEERKAKEEERKIQEERREKEEQEKANAFKSELSRLENELRITTQKLLVCEKELEQERTFRQIELSPLIVTKPQKPQSDLEQVVRESGGAQFASNPSKTDFSKSDPSLFAPHPSKTDRATEESDSSDLRGLGMELDALERAEKEKEREIERAQQSTGTTPLLHPAFNQTLPTSKSKSVEALKAKQKRNCVTCV